MPLLSLEQAISAQGSISWVPGTQELQMNAAPCWGGLGRLHLCTGDQKSAKQKGLQELLMHCR